MNALPAFEHAKVLVIGDVMLDRYWFGDVNRISPEAPVPVLKVSSVDARPGGAANVARNIAALGAQATLLSVVGADEPGAALEKLLKAHPNLSATLHRDASISTIIKLRAVARHQQLLRIDFDTPPSHEVLHSVLADFHAKLPPNLSEFREVAGSWRSEAELNGKAEQLRTELELDALLVTRSEDGMSLYRANESLHEPSQTREVFDVSGAGDTVIATLAVKQASGADLPAAMRIANRAAGIVVGKLGTTTNSRDEIMRDIEAGTGK